MAGARDQGRAAMVPVSDKGGCELKYGEKWAGLEAILESGLRGARVRKSIIHKTLGIKETGAEIPSRPLSYWATFRDVAQPPCLT